MPLPTPLQTAIGTLLLKAGPQRPGLDKALVTMEHWRDVLDALPQGSFDPTLPIQENGEPWLFCFMEHTRYQVAPGYDLFVQRHGPEILLTRNKAGHTLLEALYEESRLREQAPKGSAAQTIPMETLAQIMSLSPLHHLRLPDDGEAIGSTWLMRMMNLKGPQLPKRFSRPFPDQVLLEHGVSPNQLRKGKPLGADIQDEATLKLFLEHGLDVNQSTGNPLDPTQTVATLLVERSKEMGAVLGNHASTGEVAPAHVSVNFSAGVYGNTQAETLDSLVRTPGWDQIENDMGVPAFWLAMRRTPFVLTVLRKPRHVATTVSALARRDSRGRSGWFHWLTQLGGTREAFRNDDHAQWATQHLPDGSLMTPDGNGLYAQAVELLADMRRAQLLSNESRHDDPWKISFHSLTPDPTTLCDGLKNLSQEDWWGNQEAQQRLAQRLLVDFAKTVHTSPQNWNTDFFSLNKLQGDLTQLHPELIGSLLVINYANRIKGTYEYHSLDGPIRAFDNTPWATHSGRVMLANDDAVAIIKKVVLDCLQIKLLNTPTEADHNVRAKDMKDVNERLRRARDCFIKTEPFWRQFLATSAAAPSLEGPPRRARHRP